LFPKCNGTGRSLLIMFRPRTVQHDPTVYLNECITALTNYLVDDRSDRDFVRLRIRNTVNVQNNVVILVSDAIRLNLMWSGACWVRFLKLMRSSGQVTDLKYMHAGSGRMAEKTKGKFLDVLFAIKRSIVVVKTPILRLVHALFIVMTSLNGDPEYKSYKNHSNLKQPVEDLLSASGAKLTNDSGRK